MFFVRILAGLILCFCLGCVTVPPRIDYTLARSAIQSAKAVQAERHSPGFWTKADEYFRTAEEHFGKEKYDSAKKLFKLARLYAERAENIARIKKFKNGDGE